MAQHPTLNVMRILWMAMLVATTMYVGLAFSGVLKPPPEPVVPMMPFVFGLLALVLTIVSFALPHHLPFFAAGAALIAIRFPTQPKILAGFEAARDASFPSSRS
ncbi:hypothetical protein [Polyangium mundeleinium]|uniref:Transmembrane protein n=1 Tax=Polyangium mundeleinium TaxID=2995306 RepID=A0ABT5FA41_9BACT|nr:hypothetical protein [Polyangium mundeleinium]MDC0750042.1 hypothetical protein [Polyangium mundeleinium]